ncbi:MAG TPA: hypothetical protein PLK30_17860 [Blastocatellia bacterium]|nr:hypothetical protein [Blastocatellia bacterium]
MNRFEDELKVALRREEPSPDFTDRLMARITELPSPQTERKADKEKDRGSTWWQKITAVLHPPQMKWAMAGAMAAVLIISVVGVNRYRQHQIELQRQAEIAEAEGQRAKEQVMFAMRIASAKLNVAQKKVKDTLQHDDSK